jgi:quercetin dioxygenase-like cupin family protein
VERGVSDSTATARNNKHHENTEPMKIMKNLNVLGLGTHGSEEERGLRARRGAFVSLGIATVLTALVITSLATPGAGIVSATIMARASFKEAVDLKFKLRGDQTETIHVAEARDTVVQRIVIAPGGTTGWHSHPGPAVAIIAAGELTVFSSEDPACTPRVYSAGEAFVDPGQGHVHIAFNLGNENVEVWVTYFDVPPGGSVRIDAASPGNCGF